VDHIRTDIYSVTSITAIPIKLPLISMGKGGKFY
jgi:hypothetical protein